MFYPCRAPSSHLTFNSPFNDAHFTPQMQVEIPEPLLTHYTATIFTVQWKCFFSTPPVSYKRMLQNTLLKWIWIKFRQTLLGFILPLCPRSLFFELISAENCLPPPPPPPGY